jgi:hypothetical protein
MNTKNRNVPIYSFYSFQDLDKGPFDDGVLAGLDRPEIEDDGVLVDAGKDGGREETKAAGQLLGGERGGADCQDL